jgi:hypothetical protein
MSLKRPQGHPEEKQVPVDWAQEPAAGPEAAAAHIRAELLRWDRVLKAAGVGPS